MLNFIKKKVEIVGNAQIPEYFYIDYLSKSIKYFILFKYMLWWVMLDRKTLHTCTQWDVDQLKLGEKLGF